MSRFAQAAMAVKEALSGTRTAAADRDTEWQRVNSAIADILKDVHMSYAKLARLQGDFRGPELEQLEQLSEDVLSIGETVSRFSRAFYEGKVEMAESNIVYGQDGAPMAAEAPPPPGPPSDAPEPEIPMEFEGEDLEGLEGLGEEEPEEESKGEEQAQQQ